MPPKLAEIVDEFAAAPREVVLEMLLEFSDAVAPLPAELAGHDGMEQVPECQTPFFLKAEVTPLVQITPGPVFTTATFIGYLIAGTSGAIVATIGMFAPSFVFVPLIDRLLAAIGRWAWVRAALDGINVVAVALMAGVSAQLARTALVDPLTIALAVGTLGVLLRWRPNPTWLIAAGATVGLLRGWLT